MCFTLEIKTKKKPKPEVATEDIKVYKCITDSPYGVYYPLIINDKKEIYTKGYEYEETTPFRGSYIAEPDTYSENRRLKIEGNCFHSCTTRHFANNRKQYRWHKVVIMTIPKGALYYKNKEEYVSNRLIYPHDNTKS